MAKRKHKPRKTKGDRDHEEKAFIGKVSKYSKDRMHVEVPQTKKQKWKPGDYARVDPIN